MLFCIHQVNWVNPCSDFVVRTVAGFVFAIIVIVIICCSQGFVLC